MKNWYLATYKKTDGTHGTALVLSDIEANRKYWSILYKRILLSVCSMIKQYKTVYYPNLTTG